MKLIKLIAIIALSEFFVGTLTMAINPLIGLINWAVMASLALWIKSLRLRREQ